MSSVLQRKWAFISFHMCILPWGVIGRFSPGQCVPLNLFHSVLWRIAFPYTTSRTDTALGKSIPHLWWIASLSWSRVNCSYCHSCVLSEIIEPLRLSIALDAMIGIDGHLKQCAKQLNQILSSPEFSRQAYIVILSEILHWNFTGRSDTFLMYR